MIAKAGSTSGAEETLQFAFTFAQGMGVGAALANALGPKATNKDKITCLQKRFMIAPKARNKKACSLAEKQIGSGFLVWRFRIQQFQMRAALDSTRRLALNMLTAA